MNRLRVIARRELFRVASLNSLSVAIKIVIGLMTSKVIAVLIGPAGMALTGNLRNFLTSVESAATLGFQNGIVKYVSDSRDDDELKKFLSTVIICLIASTLLLSIVLFLFADWLNARIFSSANDYPVVFKALALGLPWYVASMVLIAILNGFANFRSVIYINILGNFLGLLVSIIFIYELQTLGALLAIVISPSLMFFITIFFIRDSIGFSLLKPSKIHAPAVRNLAEYSLMALIAAIAGPIVMLAIRNNVIQELGIAKAGLWEGLQRMSSYYLLFLSTILAVYFLPNLARTQTRGEMKAVFNGYFKMIIPVFSAVLAIIFLLRDLVIQILFSDEFSGMSPLFFWQLLGDLLKACSLILGYAFFAKKLTTAFIITEIFSLCVLWISSISLIRIFDINGIVMAHALTYAIYLLVLMIYFRKTLGSSAEA